METKTDFSCAICQTTTMKGEEYGYIYHINTYKSCILCVQAAEEMCIEVQV